MWGAVCLSRVKAEGGWAGACVWCNVRVRTSMCVFVYVWVCAIRKIVCRIFIFNPRLISLVCCLEASSVNSTQPAPHLPRHTLFISHHPSIPFDQFGDLFCVRVYAANFFILALFLCDYHFAISTVIDGLFSHSLCIDTGGAQWNVSRNFSLHSR